LSNGITQKDSNNGLVFMRLMHCGPKTMRQVQVTCKGSSNTMDVSTCLKENAGFEGNLHLPRARQILRMTYPVYKLMEWEGRGLACRRLFGEQLQDQRRTALHHMQVWKERGETSRFRCQCGSCFWIRKTRIHLEKGEGVWNYRLWILPRFF
jgi:hypothetical protein